MSGPNSSVSFTSLEVPAPIEAGCSNYLEYWPRHEAADPDLPSTRVLHAATIAGSEYVRDPDGRDPLKAVRTWDASLGSFNHMHQGAGDMLRAAGLLLRASYDGGPSDFPVVRLSDPKSSIDAFLDVTEQLGDMADQRPSRELLLGGQLVHKTALIEKDSDRQAALLDVARTMYAREYESDTPWNKVKIETGQRIADIDFHRLSQRIRFAIRARQGVKGLRREAAALLLEQTDNLLRYEDILDEGGVPKHVFGEASELLTTNIVRQMDYLSPQIKGNHGQIRMGFDSEEHPEHPQGMRRKRAFDRVYTRVDANDNVIGARLWQLKAGRSPAGEYHPAIDVVCIKGIKMEQIFQLARLLRRSYASGNYGNRPSPLPLVSAAVTPFMQPAAKAA